MHVGHSIYRYQIGNLSHYLSNFYCLPAALQKYCDLSFILSVINVLRETIDTHVDGFVDGGAHGDGRKHQAGSEPTMAC